MNQGYPSLSLVVASFAHLDVGECLLPLSSPLQKVFCLSMVSVFSVYENLHSSTKSFITLFILCKTLIKAHADRSLILELLEKRFGHVYISTYGIKLGDETAFHDYISWPVFRFYYMLDIHFLQVYKNKQNKQKQNSAVIDCKAHRLWLHYL